MSVESDSTMQLLVPPDAEPSELIEFQNTLQKMGYEVSKEYDSDHQRVYNVYSQPDRTSEAFKTRWSDD